MFTLLIRCFTTLKMAIKTKGALKTSSFGTNPNFLEKSRALAFQAADFNAWKMRTALQESNKPTHTLEIGSNLLRSIAVLENVRKEAGVLNEWSFRTFCERMGVNKR